MPLLMVVGDGMADHPLPELDGRTPLEACRTPHLDRLARAGCGGRVHTIPDSLEPGTDVALLSLLGYDPEACCTGRAPFEAAGLGVPLAEGETAFRCNLVTADGDRLVDHSAGHIPEDQARELIALLRQRVREPGCRFVSGQGFRNLLILSGPRAAAAVSTVPPQDILGRPYPDHLPRGPGGDLLARLVRRSREVLDYAPLNARRRRAGLPPANLIWPWGQGAPPRLEPLCSPRGLRGAVISAVPLVRGIGVYAGLVPETVEGATGFLDTDYAAKVRRTLSLLESCDLILLHVEAPDEAGHLGDLGLKMRAIEDFDARVIGPLREGLSGFRGEVRLLVLTDHATPVRLRGHARGPVPFVLHPAPGRPDRMRRLTEKEAERGSLGLLSAGGLFRRLIDARRDVP